MQVTGLQSSFACVFAVTGLKNTNWSLLFDQFASLLVLYCCHVHCPAPWCFLSPEICFQVTKLWLYLVLRLLIRIFSSFYPLHACGKFILCTRNSLAVMCVCPRLSSLFIDCNFRVRHISTNLAEPMHGAQKSILK